MNSYIVLLFSILFLLFLTFKGIIKNYNSVTADNYFSMKQTNWLRGLAIIGIAYSHYMVRLDINNKYLWQIGFLGVFGVAIFLFLSGYSAMISFNNKPNYLKGYIPKRLTRLYVPFIISFVIYSIVLLLTGYKFTLFNVVDIFILSLPSTLNWYLKVQLALYILFYVYTKFIRKQNILLLVTYLSCFIYMIIGITTGIENFWYESCYMFPLGMTFAIYKEKIFKYLNCKYLIKFITSCLIFVLTYIPVYLFGGVFSEIIFVLGFIQFMLVSCVRFVGDSRLTVFFGVCSLEFYLSHTISPNIIDEFYKGQENLLVFVIFIVLSSLIAIIIKKLSGLINNYLGRIIK